MPQRSYKIETGLKIHLTTEQEQQVERCLRCIDSVAARVGTSHTCNALAIVQAMTLLNDEEIPASMADDATAAIARFFDEEAPTAVDEALIARLYSAIYATPARPRRAIDRLFGAGRTATSAATFPVTGELRTLVEWLQARTLAQNVHPVLLAGIFAYEFIAIHPVDRGKMLMAHLLAMLIMTIAGYRWVVAAPPLTLLAADVVAYHRALRTGLQNRYTPQEDITAWILLWVDALYSAAQNLTAQLSPALQTDLVAHRSYLNQRQHRILAFIEKNQPVKLADIAKHLHKESVNTIKKDLKRLRDAGYIASEGVLKGTVYYRN